MSPCHEFIRNTRNTPVLPHHRLQSAGGAVCEASEGLNQSDEGEAGGALRPTSPLSLCRAHTHTHKHGHIPSPLRALTFPSHSPHLTDTRTERRKMSG